MARIPGDIVTARLERTFPVNTYAASLYDLPEGILARGLPVDELEEVHAADVELLPRN